MRFGVIQYSSNAGPAANNNNVAGKPIKVNITVWVYFDIVPHLAALNKPNKRSSNTTDRKVKEVFEKEYGQEGREFLNLFEVVLDCTQFSNLEIMGSRFLKYQENFIIESFAA